MIVDSSVIVAILLGEDDAFRYVQAMNAAPVLRMSVANWLETTMVVDREDDPGARAGLDDLFQQLNIVLEPVSVQQAQLAREAWQRFGRGRHPAKLNYGDCFAYALTQERGETLLFKGSDFSQTDIRSALEA